MAKISYTNCVRNEVLHRGKDEKEYTKYNKAKEEYLDWSHLAYEQPSKHVIEGNTEVT